jgi:hypothetical protein
MRVKSARTEGEEDIRRLEVCMGKDEEVGSLI